MTQLMANLTQTQDLDCIGIQAQMAMDQELGTVLKNSASRVQACHRTSLILISKIQSGYMLAHTLVGIVGMTTVEIDLVEHQTL